ncbi:MULTISPECIES: DUF6415 family natural product biosynthesis protein [unclassified Streptomyces]|uniref:DUF6415 family natural product biosynthesis protein n=1 Tax=unclassified Streptomyces TaxID=2593676 RepID=UPI00381081A2
MAAFLRTGCDRLEAQGQTAYRDLLDHVDACPACRAGSNLRAIADDCDNALSGHLSTASHAALTDRAALLRRHLAMLVPMGVHSTDEVRADQVLQDAAQLLAEAPPEDRMRAWVQMRALARVTRTLADVCRPRGGGSICETGTALRRAARRTW